MLGIVSVKRIGGNWDGGWEEGSKKRFGNYFDGHKDLKSVNDNGHIKEKMDLRDMSMVTPSFE